MKKIDKALVVELFGVGLMAVGVAIFSIPMALIVVGGLLVWLTEKAG